MLAAGADDFLTKPFSVVQLRARVKAALRLEGRPGPLRAAQRPPAVPLNGELERTVSARTGN